MASGTFLLQFQEQAPEMDLQLSDATRTETRAREERDQDIADHWFMAVKTATAVRREEPDQRPGKNPYKFFEN